MKKQNSSFSPGKKDRSFFQIAKKISCLSDNKKFKIGAVIVDGHRIISTGFNEYKSHPIQKKYNKKYRDLYGDGVDGMNHSIHAELSALLPLIRDKTDLSHAEIYIWRNHKDGTPALARPCPACRKIIAASGIKVMKYTSDENFESETVKEDI